MDEIIKIVEKWNEENDEKIAIHPDVSDFVEIIWFKTKTKPAGSLFFKFRLGDITFSGEKEIEIIDLLKHKLKFEKEIK